MKKEELQKRIDEIKWFHRIELPYDEGGVIETPGVVDHCTEKIANERYGLPLDLAGKTVLDIGAYDGYFSFLAEQRGAKVSAIDPLQGRGSIFEAFGEGLKVKITGDEGIRFAKSVLDSKINYAVTDLDGLVNGIGKYSQRGIISENIFDIVLYYGVLYHIESPLLELQYLSKITREYSLIETAIAQNYFEDRPFWEFNHGFDGDTTNKWYPTILGLQRTLKYVGFYDTELIYNDGIRATLKAYK